MLEGQLEVITNKKEEEQTTSVYQSSHSTLPTLLEQRLTGLSCMGLSMRLEAILMVHFTLSTTTMCHVQFAMLQHEELF